MYCYDSSPRAQQWFAIVLLVTMAAYCMIASSWMVSHVEYEIEKKKNWRHHATQCSKGIVCKAKTSDILKCGNYIKHCNKVGFTTTSLSSIPESCGKDHTFLKQSRQEIDNKLNKEAESRSEEMSDEELSYLRNATQSYTPARIIIQWIPIKWEVVASSSAWYSPLDYYRYLNYTISPGPMTAYAKGKIIVPETGLYYVYAKLTFSCTRVDKKHTKRVAMNITTKEIPGDRYTILGEQQRVTCYKIGDVTTLFQSGLFRFGIGQKIYIQYQAFKDVQISQGENDRFKSMVGMHRVGHA